MRYKVSSLPSCHQNMNACVFCDVSSQKKSIKSSSWTTLDKFDLIRVFDEYNACVCKRRTIKELMVFSTLVVSQTTRVTKTHLAHIALVRFLVRVNTRVFLQTISSSKTLFAHITFVRFLVRVNTHVFLQTISSSKTHLAHIALVRFLVRVNTHVALSNHQNNEKFYRTHHIHTVSRSCEYARVSGQVGWILKHLLANIALVPSLPLPSLPRSLFFSHLFSLVRNLQTQHQIWFFFLSLQNRPRVHRSFRTWILSSHHSLLLLLFVVVVLVLKRFGKYESRTTTTTRMCEISKCGGSKNLAKTLKPVKNGSHP